MFIPLRADLDSKKFPLVTVILIVLNLSIFAYQIFSEAHTDNEFTRTFMLVPAQVVESPFGWSYLRGTSFKLPLFLTLFTCTFLHGGYLHLLGNMLYLWIFGNGVEGSLGTLRFLIFYFCAGLTANLCHIAIDPSSSVGMVGASGAIAGILGAFLLLHPKVKILTFFCPFPLIFFTRLLRVPAFLFLLVWIGMQILYLKMLSAAVSNIAFGAHVGGFISGMILALFLN